MNLARVVRYPSDTTDSLQSLLTRHELTLLQLDYATRQPTLNTGAVERMLDDLRIVHKQLYLDPSLQCVVQLPHTSVAKAMQEVAEFLCDHGSGEMQICGIRGSNLLAELSDYPFHPAVSELEQIVAAELELGAGPLATALVEGAQLVIVGCCDPAASFLAAETAWGETANSDLSRRGQIAVGACLAGYLTVIVPEGVRYLPAAIARSRESGLSVHCADRLGTDRLQLADVAVDLGHATFVSTPRGEYILEGVEATIPTGEWRVRLLRNAGSRVDLLVRVTQAELEGLQQILAELADRSVLGEVFQPFDLAGAVHNDPRLLVRVAFTAGSSQECEVFSERLTEIASTRGNFEIMAPEPTVRPALQTEYTYLSADEVTLSVDTRPASEWL